MTITSNADRIIIERHNIYGLKAGDPVYFYSIKTTHNSDGTVSYEFSELEYHIMPFNHYSNPKLLMASINIEDKKKQKLIKYDEGVVNRSTVWLKVPDRNKALELLRKDTANSRDDAKKVVDLFDKKIQFIHHLMHHGEDN